MFKALSFVGSVVFLLPMSVDSLLAVESGNKYLIRAQVSLWNAKSGGDFDFSNPSSSTPDVSMDDLDLSDSSGSLRYEISAQLPLFFDVYLGGFSYGEDGNVALGGGLTDDFTFGDTDFTNENISTDFSVNDTYVELAWRPVNLFAGVSIGLAIHKQDITAKVTAVGVSEVLDETVYFPTLSARAWFNLPAGVMIEGGVQYLSVSISDYKAKYTEANVQVSYRPMDKIGIFLGYQITQMDLDFDKVGGISSVVANYDLSGPYIGLLAQF